MTSRSSCAVFSLTLSLILWHCVLISAEDTTTPLSTSTLVPHGNQQATVGWVSNPKRRGTLTIIIECLTTIFACTWTVLHLNIPARRDTTIKRVQRKVKWMAITILFPEFIFVKAVCELRCALYTLDMMYRSVQQTPKKFEWRSMVNQTESLLWFSRTWTVHFEPLQISLYKLLLRHAPLADSRPKSSQPEVLEEYIPGPVYGYIQVQKWTLTHAYYVNMGGIVAQNQSTETPGKIGYPVVRGDHFADSKRRAWKLGHPLKGLQLSANDIKDKSKADWVVKTIAIIQIGRLVLDLVTRSIGGQPVTQLEIATASFAAFAIVTQLVNWWKPKDVTQPTPINAVVDEESLYGPSTELFFAPRLWSPGQASREAKGDVEDGTPPADTMSSRIHVADDELWIDKSNLFLAWSLMIGSCLVFGGIHCIAWVFRFPTRVEQLAWQTAALASMMLPMIGWAVLYLIYLYRPRKNKETLVEAIEATLDFFDADLLDANNDWWDTFTTAVDSPKWNEWIQKHHPTTSSKDIKRLKWELKTMGKLRSLLRDLWRNKQRGRRSKQEEMIRHIWAIENDLKASGSTTYALRDQYETWIKDQDAFLYGVLPTKKDPEDPTRTVEDPEASAEFKAWVQEQGQLQKIPLWENWVKKQAVHRNSVQRKSTGEYYLRHGEPDVGLFSWIFSRCDANKRGSQTRYLEMWRDFDNKKHRHSRFLNMVVAMLYTVARLMLLAIMFSSLRAAPDGVYDTPDWIRFLPSFS